MPALLTIEGWVERGNTQRCTRIVAQGLAAHLLSITLLEQAAADEGASLKSTNKGPDAVTALGEQVKDLATKAKAAETAKSASATAEETALKSADTVGLNYLKAYNAAILAEQKLAELGAN